MKRAQPEPPPPTFHIAVDMDDVLVDFIGGLLGAVYTEFDVRVDLDEVTDWNLRPLLDPIIGRNWWDWLREREWLWANFPAVPGAIGGIERLRADGHYIEVVTSKPKWAEHNVWKWLGKWRPAIQQVTIVGPKDVKAEHTKADILIDDKPQNIDEFMATDRIGILFGRPHNRSIHHLDAHFGQDCNLSSHCDYTDTWAGILKLIKEITDARKTG